MPEALALAVGLLAGALVTALVLRNARRQGFASGRESRHHELAESHTAQAVAGERAEHALQRVTELTAECEQLRRRLEEVQGNEARLERELASATTAGAKEREHHQQQLALLEAARNQLGAEFKNLANEIFERKHEQFANASRERLGALLDPLGQRLAAFEEKIGKVYADEARERIALGEQLKQLAELNHSLGAEASQLSEALRGHGKVQGDWGEVILGRVLEKSGLTEGREYRKQQSHTSEAGSRLQPDVIIELPGDKQLVIDSKVSLTAYTRYCASNDPAERENALKDHVTSLRRHITGLAEKNYQHLYQLNTLDFVLLFIPIEPAFALAVQHDLALFDYAFERNIVIVSPATLLATLRTIASIWRHEYQDRHAQEIARQAGALYDKFVNFVADLEEVGKRLRHADDSYRSALNKLTTGRGNLVDRAERVRELGARTAKQLPSHLVGRSDDSDQDADADQS